MQTTAHHLNKQTINIKEIADELNDKSGDYIFGELRDLRKEIKGLSKKASSSIFTDQLFLLKVVVHFIVVD